MTGMFGKIKQAIFGNPARNRGQFADPKQAAIPAYQQLGNRPSGQPVDFCPISVGTRWHFTINVSGDPLHFGQIGWPMGNGQVRVQTRGRFGAVVRDRSRRQFELKIAIARPSEVQGPLKYPGGVELTVENDDLGVYEGHRQVFWAVASHHRFEVLEVVAYSPDHPSAPRMGSWGSWGESDGNSVRFLFFGERPGIAISLGEDSPDRLAFEGFDSTKTSQWGGSVLHFVRQVKAAEEPGELSKAFEEHTWYAYGRGLVELKQFVSGRETMHWVLQSFQRGSR
jgi:hypothetical protein